MGSAWTPWVLPTAKVLDLLPRTGGQRLHQPVGAGQDQLSDVPQLQPEGGVEHVRRGEPEVDPAPGLPGGGAEDVDEGGHIVIGDPLALLDRLDGEARAADRLELGLGGAVGAEQERQLLGGRHLHAPPRLHARLVAPQAAELRPRVAGDHAWRIWAARMAALRGLSRPTHATGTPGGICTIDRIASSPPAAVRRPDNGTPITGRSVWAATRTRKGRRDPGAGDDHPQSPHACVLGVFGDEVRLAVGRHHPHLVQDARAL